MPLAMQILRRLNLSQPFHIIFIILFRVTLAAFHAINKKLLFARAAYTLTTNLIRLLYLLATVIKPGTIYFSFKNSRKRVGIIIN